MYFGSLSKVEFFLHVNTGYTSVCQVMKRIDGTPAPAHSKQGQHPLVQAAVETGEALQAPRQP